MKTTVKNLAITEDLAINFKSSYSVKMGGTQTIVFLCGTSFNFDDREYYSGRGAKYNSSISHESLGNVIVSKNDLKDYVKRINEREVRIAGNAKAKKAADKRILEAKKEGIYSINENGYVELTDNEWQEKTFEASRLANTLKISIQDAELLNSEGKTYVFAKSEDGNTYELYHSDLSCNSLSIYVGIATPERIAEFKPAEWQSAPFASEVGQTSNNNHFVC